MRIKYHNNKHLQHVSCQLDIRAWWHALATWKTIKLWKLHTSKVHIFSKHCPSVTFCASASQEWYVLCFSTRLMRWIIIARHITCTTTNLTPQFYKKQTQHTSLFCKTCNVYNCNCLAPCFAKNSNNENNVANNMLRLNFQKPLKLSLPGVQSILIWHRHNLTQPMNKRKPQTLQPNT